MELGCFNINDYLLYFIEINFRTNIVMMNIALLMQEFFCILERLLNTCVTCTGKGGSILSQRIYRRGIIAYSKGN